VKIEERGGLVLGNNVVVGLVADGGEGGAMIIIVVDRQRREIDRSAFSRDTVKGGVKMSVGRIAFGLRRGSLAFCISRTGECRSRVT
jgi:hypothetical protein